MSEIAGRMLLWANPMTQQIFAKEPLGGHWNAAQRLVAVVGVVLFVAASVVPPWSVPTHIKQRLWGLLFDPPAGATEIDWPILVFEWGVLLVATVILVWVFRGRSQSEQA